MCLIVSFDNSLVVYSPTSCISSTYCSLPYTEATLREVMRHETLVPSGLPHTALRDTKFMGYDIPKVI